MDGTEPLDLRSIRPPVGRQLAGYGLTPASARERARVVKAVTDTPRIRQRPMPVVIGAALLAVGGFAVWAFLLYGVLVDGAPADLAFWAVLAFAASWLYVATWAWELYDVGKGFVAFLIVLGSVLVALFVIVVAVAGAKGESIDIDLDRLIGKGSSGDGAGAAAAGAVAAAGSGRTTSGSWSPRAGGAGSAWSFDGPARDVGRTIGAVIEGIGEGQADPLEGPLAGGIEEDEKERRREAEERAYRDLLGEGSAEAQERLRALDDRLSRD